MVDKVVPRKDLPKTLGNLLRVLLKRPAASNLPAKVEA